MIIIKTGFKEFKLAQDIKKDKPGQSRINQYLHRYDRQRSKSKLNELFKTEKCDYSVYENL